MPVLYILGGANGVGKTSWYNTSIKEGFIDPALSFINVDTITLKELGGYTAENFVKAEAIARERIARHIDKKETFMIESNLAKASDYEWIERMESKGYETVLYFLGTDDIEINKNRVRERVQEGGHDVPDNIIEQRYRMGISYLKTKILLFKEAYLVDNSLPIPQEIAHLKDFKSGRGLTFSI